MCFILSRNIYSIVGHTKYILDVHYKIIVEWNFVMSALAAILKFKIVY